MLKQLAVIQYDKKAQAYIFASVADGKTLGIKQIQGDKEAVQYIKQCKLSTKDLQFVNFDVKNGEIIQSAGNFARLQGQGTIRPVLILARIVNRAGRLVQYLCLDTMGNTGRVPVMDVYKQCVIARNVADSMKNKQLAYVANGIFNTTGEGKMHIRAYEGYSFPTIEVELEDKAKLKPKKSMVDVKKNTKALEEKENKFTKEQMHELSAAKKAGVDPVIIANPEFTPEQMKIIWEAKRDGCKADLFADPGYSASCMTFLRGIMQNGEPRMKEIKPLLSRKYDASQMREIYLGIIQGLDFTSYMGYDNTAEDMRFKRQCLKEGLGIEMVQG